ncbi:hypothetical protein CXB51_031102 [Gossypium anomalum]|uniref:Myb/SANT-like domain-containing protein n=1 Tax=Gossypium anomalum TaxID=47600 RepID=A0A8J6CM94_9ROSI|nr:hypothetical protein CXB51_031102 [Gossypium anomalum]
MLGVCTPDMHFVYVLPGWEGFVANGRILRDAISSRHGNFIRTYMSFGPIEPELGEVLPNNVIDDDELNIAFHNQLLLPKILEKEKRKWVLEEDATLVSCMVDLYNVGTYNANTRSKAKPNLGSRIRTLKRDWAIVYDMLNGKDNSGFGWDEQRQMVVVEDAVHKAATKKDAQTAAYIVEEIDVEDVATTNNPEEGNNYHRCEDNVFLNEMDVSATQSQPSKPNQDGFTFLKKKKNISDGSEQISTSITDVAMLLGEKHRLLALN